MKQANYPIVDSVEKLEEALARVRAAQRKFATYTQEQVDKIFKAAAIAANKPTTRFVLTGRLPTSLPV